MKVLIKGGTVLFLSTLLRFSSTAWLFFGVWTICIHGKLTQKSVHLSLAKLQILLDPIYSHLADVTSVSNVRSEVRCRDSQ